MTVDVPFPAYRGERPFVFVSYAHADSAAVFREIERLHRLGYRIWYDEGIDPSSEWPEEIAAALAGCALFVVFITSRAVTSRNVRNEINFALDRRKTFLAIHLEATELPAGLQLRMGDIQAILKYRTPEDRYLRLIETAFAGARRASAADRAAPRPRTREPTVELDFGDLGL